MSAGHALTRAMACDHGPENIRVNAICPGYVDTPMLQSFFGSMGDPERLEDEARRVHPMRRYGTPHDMANLVNWLAGDEARYASGQLWVLDGGLSAQIQQMRDWAVRRQPDTVGRLSRRRKPTSWPELGDAPGWPATRRATRRVSCGSWTGAFRRRFSRCGSEPCGGDQTL